MRKAFSMITAIVIIVLMATVSAFVMNLSGKMVQSTTTQFQHEQSVILARSYTEYAVMAVTANDHTANTCLNNITGGMGDDGTGTPVYDINVTISYIGTPTANLHPNCNLTAPTSNTVIELDSPLHIIVDVFVSYRELDHPLGAGAPPITYHRRSLQKI